MARSRADCGHAVIGTKAGQVGLRPSGCWRATGSCPKPARAPAPPSTCRGLDATRASASGSASDGSRRGLRSAARCTVEPSFRLISAASRLGDRRSHYWTEEQAMPLTTDEKLLALSRETIEVFDEVNGGVHPGFRPAHAKGILVRGMFTPSPEAGSLTRAPHLHRNSTPVTVRF